MYERIHTAPEIAAAVFPIKIISLFEICHDGCIIYLYLEHLFLNRFHVLLRLFLISIQFHTFCFRFIKHCLTHRRSFKHLYDLVVYDGWSVAAKLIELLAASLSIGWKNSRGFLTTGCHSLSCNIVSPYSSSSI
jgi:hypothetical protein